MATTDPRALRAEAFSAVMPYPTRFDGLGPALLDRTLQALDLAHEKVRAVVNQLPAGAERIPADRFEDPSADQSPFTRTALMAWAASFRELHQAAAMHRTAAGSLRAAHTTHVPAGSLSLGAALELPEVPCPIDDMLPVLAQQWRLIDDEIPGHPGRALLVHTSGATLWLDGVPGSRDVRGWRLHQSTSALTDQVVFSMVLPAEVAQELAQALVDNATDIRPGLAGLVERSHGLSIRAWASMDAGNGRTLGFWVISTEAPYKRMALLATVEGPSGLMGFHLLERGECFDQMTRLVELAGPQDKTPITALLAQSTDLQASLMSLADAGHGEDVDTLSEGLRPRAGDAAKVFSAEVAAQVHTATEAFWEAKRPRLRPRGGQGAHTTQLLTAQQLQQPPDSVPGAWAAIAPWIQPHTIWASVVFHEPGTTSGMRYDGLVWVEDHWAWFPKPWRLLPSS